MAWANKALGREDPLAKTAARRYWRAVKALVAAIVVAKARCKEDLLRELDGDPWGRPYKGVMEKLRPWAPPLTESLDPVFLEEVLCTLFSDDAGEGATQGGRPPRRLNGGRSGRLRAPK